MGMDTAWCVLLVQNRFTRLGDESERLEKIGEDFLLYCLLTQRDLAGQPVPLLNTEQQTDDDG